MATKLINNVDFNDYGFGDFLKSHKNNTVMSGEKRDKIAGLRKTEKKADKEKADLLEKENTFPLELHFGRLTMIEAVNLIASPQSVIVGIQAMLRKLGDNALMEIAAGTYKTKEDDIFQVKPNGICVVNIHQFLNRPKATTTKDPVEKLQTQRSKLTQSEQDQADIRMLIDRGRAKTEDEAKKILGI